MKKNIVASFALLALFAACNDEYSDQFDINSGVTDVKNITMTLASSDYATIAGNATNAEIALAKDPEGKTGMAALEAVGVNKYFTADATAEDYIPAFLNDKYPNADLKSKFTVTFKQYQAPSNYLTDFKSISSYQLTSEDYEEVWGSKVKASFLSPSSVGKIPSILADNVEGAAEGDMVAVDYAYSETEPSIGGGSGSAEPTWIPVAAIPIRSTGANWNFVNMGPIDLSAYKGQKINIGFRYTSTDKAGATWELMNFKAMAVPYLDVCLYSKQEDGSFKKVGKSSEFKGAGEYVIATMGVDGLFYPFGRLAEGKTYGYMYPNPIKIENGVVAASDATDFVVTLTATEAGFTIKNVLGQYFYMSGNYNSFNVTTEVGEVGYDWTVKTAGGADLFTITNVEKNKSIKMNYYNGSYSYGSYPASTVENNTYAANSLLGDEGGFTVYDVDAAGLSYIWLNTEKYGWKASAFVNGVNYATDSYLVSPTFEVAENATLPYFTIDEAFRFGAGNASDLQVYVSTDYTNTAQPHSTMTRSAMTRASISANASALYRFDGEKWSLYQNDAAEVAVVEPGVYASMGGSSISDPAQVLPIYLNSKYPYAEDGERAAVVYRKNANALAVMEFTRKAAIWIETPEAVEQVVTFTKDTDGITAKISVYLEESLLGSDGGFVAQDVILTGGLNYVWQITSSYGWKGSSYSNSKNNAAESWLVSPALDFRKGTSPIMTFEEAINFIGSESVEKYCIVRISTDYKNNVTDATWTDIQLPNRAEGSSWNFFSIGEVDLSAYIGNIARIAFVYKVPNDSPVGPTWEFKNIVVKEKNAE